MTCEKLIKFCATLPHATHVDQLSNADVWKVGGDLRKLGLATKFNESELVAIARHLEGCISLTSGKLSEVFLILDEVMLSVVSDTSANRNRTDLL